jgi:hypothetical protein
MVFERPRDVLNHPGLTRAEKADILHRWRYQALQLEVAQGENMQSEADSRLREVLNALNELGHRTGRD